MADKQSDEISMPEVNACSMIDSTKSLVAKDSKKKFSIGEYFPLQILVCSCPILACFFFLVCFVISKHMTILCTCMNI